MLLLAVSMFKRVPAVKGIDAIKAQQQSCGRGQQKSQCRPA